MPLPSFTPVPLPRVAADLAGYAVVVLAARPAKGPAQGSAEGSADPKAAEPAPGASAVGRRLGVDVAGQLARAKASGSAGEVTVVPLVGAVETVLIVGVGDGSPASVLRAGAAAARSAGKNGPVLACVAAAAGVGRFVEGYALASYAVVKRSIHAEQDRPQVRVDLAVRRPQDCVEVVRRAAVTAAAVHRARDLTNTPANEKSPQWLADQALAWGTAAGLGVRVRDERELAADGFGGLIGVGQGSVRPPRFVELVYRPAGRARAAPAPHVVLVGKGIVFDSGGISIKPAAGMESMKTDMAGAAAVLATMTALADLGIAVRVTGLLAVAENLPGEAALRPGDVIAPFGGRHTVEITNTDAEGRLVLADGLAYADQVLRADAVVDVATLTGAASMALGRLDAPLYATDERLAVALLRASAESGERLWRMPLVEDYRPALASGTADLVNGVTDRALGGGSITAALFLREFVGERPWAHLDIAGTGRSDAAVGELSRGGTGFGVRLLLRFLERWH